VLVLDCVPMTGSGAGLWGARLLAPATGLGKTGGARLVPVELVIPG
jgi:hypothetical protein